MLEDFYKEHCTKFNIFLVYITEAHAADVWNIGDSAGTINFKHKTIDDRINCIKKLVTNYSVTIPIFADNMTNEFETKFAGWPFRYFVSTGTKLTKIGLPDDSEFDICEMFSYVKSL